MDIRVLGQQFYSYASHIRGFSQHTIRRYRFALEPFVRDTGVSHVEEVTSEMVRTWFYRGRSNKEWSASTFRTYYKSLKVFFGWCIRQGHLTQNPVTDIECPRLEKKLPPKLTKQEALRLLEAVFNYPYRDAYLRFRNHALFATFIFAGLRRQEVINLKLTDVDLENRSIFVRQGKGSKDRVIPMNETLAEILMRYVQARRRLGKTCPEFFASFPRNEGLCQEGIILLIKKMRAASHIRFTAHLLRHTFATLMLEGGCDIYSLSKMMGHTDISTTTIYLAASIEHLRAQISKHPMSVSSSIETYR
jgi:site-specific recombinase XerD